LGKNADGEKMKITIKGYGAKELNESLAKIKTSFEGVTEEEFEIILSNGDD
jgi:predicted DNA-binding antitoxin AbrB/MazE fold protein